MLMSLVTELLISGMYCHSVVLIVTLLTLLKIYRTSPGTRDCKDIVLCIWDSRRYMAKACADSSQ